MKKLFTVFTPNLERKTGFSRLTTYEKACSLSLYLQQPFDCIDLILCGKFIFSLPFSQLSPTPRLLG